MYKPLSEADKVTLLRLRTRTPAWLEREYPYSPPPDTKTSMKEMELLISASKDRIRLRKEVTEIDRDLSVPFKRLCWELGVPYDHEKLERLIGEASILITKMKWLYNRERPYQFAAEHGIDFVPMNSETAHSPSYPSGHTIQALLVASSLSDSFPQHRRRFMETAEVVSWSRVIGGYHWPSDVLFSKDVFRHIISPSMPSSVRLALSDSEREEREDERLVRTSPKVKPPRRDLERGRVKDRDNSESDPDKDQDDKDRSKNYKDAELMRRWGKLLVGEERVERRNGEVWKTEKGKWSGKFDGKTQVFDSKDLAERYSKGESGQESEEQKEGPKKPETRDEKILGDLKGLGSPDEKERNKAITRLSQSVSENMEKFVEDPGIPDEEALKQITKIVENFTKKPAIDTLMTAAKAKILGENSNNPDYKPTDSEISAISQEVEDSLKASMKEEIKSVDKELKSRLKKVRDSEVISGFEGEDAKREEANLLRITKDSVAKYRAKKKPEDGDSDGDGDGDDKIKERDSRLKEIKKEIKKFPEGSRGRMELESERRGIMVAKILDEGPKAKGVGPSMSIMIQAAEKTGRLDDFLNLTLIGGDNTAESQQQFRDLLKSVTKEDLASFMHEDNPARQAVEVFLDPGFIARAGSEQIEELEELVIDSILSGIIFTDAALEDAMPDSNVGQKNIARVKVRLPQNDKVMERVKKMLEDLLKKFNTTD